MTEEQDQEQKEPTLEDVQNELKELRAKHIELADNLLRKQADFDNYRKRMQKEKDESIRFANADLIEGMLEVLDDFTRAEQATQDSPSIDTLKQGISMIRTNLESVLNKRGLQKMVCVGNPFDPSIHQAIAMVDGDVQEATVAEEYQSGYRLHDRVIRPAKVRVVMPKTQGESDGG